MCMCGFCGSEAARCISLRKRKERAGSGWVRGAGRGRWGSGRNESGRRTLEQ